MSPEPTATTRRLDQPDRSAHVPRSPTSGSRCRLLICPFPNCSLLTCPLAIILLGLLASAWMGPFWVWPRPDPDYAYLLNGLNLAQGARPWHVDHPGTPVQAVIAGIIALIHTATGQDRSIPDDLIARPEFYLTAAHVALLLIIAASSFLLGLIVRRASGSTACAVAAQFMTIATMAMMGILVRVNPEPMLLAVGMLLGATALHIAAGPSQRARQIRWSALLGLLLALGIATKITFTPLALVCLASVRGARQWAILALTTAASLAAFTFPIWYRLDYLKAWIWNNIQGGWRYGRGPRTYIDPSRYPSDLLRNFSFEPAFTSLLALSTLAIITIALAHRRAVPERLARLRTLLCGIASAQVVLVLVMSKSPAPHYLVPALSLMGAALATLWIMARSLPRFSTLASSALLAGTAAASLSVAIALIDWRRELIDTRDTALAMADIVDSYPGHMIAYPYRSNSEAYSLLFAALWSGNQHGRLVTERFTNAMLLGGGGNIYRPGAGINEQKMIEWAGDGRLLYRREMKVLPPGITLEPLIELRGDTLYRAVLTQESP